MFKTDTQVLPASTGVVAPAVQLAQTAQINSWRLWYKRDHDQAPETLQPNEEQFSSKMMNRRAKIWGVTHYRPGGIEAEVESITLAELHAHTLDSYCTHFCRESLKEDGTKNHRTEGIFLMPDDPLPTSVMTGKRECRLDLMCDLTTYTTFSLFDRARDNVVAKSVKTASM